MLRSWKFQKSFDLKKYHPISKCRFYYTVKYEIDMKKLDTYSMWHTKIIVKMSSEISCVNCCVKIHFPGNFRPKFKIILEEKTNCFRSWTWCESKLENAVSEVTIPALGTDWANTDWHDKQNEVSFVTTDVTCTHSPANLWDTEEGFQYRSLIG